MYGKHFESMYTGSMVGAGAVAFAVMGYVISHQKPPSFDVELNPKILSTIIGESEEEIIETIQKFCSPDEKSRSKAEEGRKLLKLGEYLYHVVNGEEYDRIRNNEERREYWREQKRKKRQKRPVRSAKSEAVEKGSTCPTPEQIYEAYPLKVGRPKAVTAIRNAIKRGVDAEILLSKTLKFSAARSGNLEFCPHPATWFNQERYNDDPKTWNRDSSVNNQQNKQRVDRSIGTANEGTAALYKGLGKVSGV